VVSRPRRGQVLRFAAFAVDPGTRRGGKTTITVTYYEVGGPHGALTPFETFTLVRPRSDA
jgi:hypothetical protein